jgi:hypothetical protein
MCGDVSMFSSGREWTPRDELYNIANQSIDLNLGLHEPIGILELSTFNCLQHRLFLYDGEIWILASFSKLFI